MRRLSLLVILVLLLTAILCGCGDKEDENWAVVSTDGEGTASEYMATEEKTEAETGGTPTEVFHFSELPEEYTPEQALLDGCLVLQWDEGATTPRVRGIDYWENFLAVSRNKEKISLRIVYFTSSHYWFSDLYYSHEMYSLYTRDTYSENQIGPYKYFTEIVGEDIYSGKPVNCFIFTDDPELGAEDVLSLTHICDIEAERKVAFTIVDFTTYLK